MNFNERVYALVRLIPPGKVTSYGRVATLLENPRGARAVGWALAALPEGSDVPWHRVVNSQRRVSARYPGDDGHHQQKRLEAEGISFSADGRVPAAVFWNPSLWEIRDSLEPHSE